MFAVLTQTLSSRVSVIALLALGLSSLGLAGCAVGPDFTSPPAPDVDRYTAKPPTSADGASASVTAALRPFDRPPTNASAPRPSLRISASPSDAP